MKLKHNKIKNTGLIFELLTRALVNDTLNNKKSPASNIIKTFYKGTELSKEYKLYEFLTKNKNLTELKANSIIETVLNRLKTINNTRLKSEKYNLINEIKKHYNLNEFFKLITPDYKLHASIYLLFEIEKSDKKINLLEQTIKYKNVIVENITVNDKKINTKKNFIKEYSEQDNITRALTQKILVDNYNTKYNNLTESQKMTIKNYISNYDNPELLLEYYNKRVFDVTKYVVKNIKKIESDVIKVKLKESLKYLKPLINTRYINDDKIINLLHFDELIDNIKINLQ